MYRRIAAATLLALLLPPCSAPQAAQVAQIAQDESKAAVQDYRLDQLEKRLDRVDDRLERLPTQLEGSLDDEARAIERWSQSTRDDLTSAQNTIMIILGLLALLGGGGVWSVFRTKKDIERTEDELNKSKEAVDKAREEIERLKTDIEAKQLEIEKIAESCHSLHDQARSDAEVITDLVRKMPDGKKLTRKQRTRVNHAADDKTLPHSVRLTARGLRAEEEERWSDAIEIWRQALELEPDAQEFIFRLAYSAQQAASKQTQAEQALPLLRQAAEHYETYATRTPNSDATFNNWGATLGEWAKLTKDETKLEQACEKYKKATELNPENADAFSNWGNTLDEWGKLTKDEAKLEQACDKCKKATKINPEHAGAFYNWGNTLNDWGKLTKDEAKLAQACEKYRVATKINPSYATAFNNWGSTLDDWGKLTKDEAKLEQACEKYKQATVINPAYVKAFNNWGASLTQLAQGATGERRQSLLQEAKDRTMQAERLEPGKGAYNLACIAAMSENAEDCRRWLEVCLEHGTMPKCAYLRGDADLDSVRETDWFKEIEAKVCAEGADAAKPAKPPRSA